MTSMRAGTLSGPYAVWGVGTVPKTHPPPAGAPDSVASLDRFDFGISLTQGLKNLRRAPRSGYIPNRAGEPKSTTTCVKGGTTLEGEIGLEEPFSTALNNSHWDARGEESRNGREYTQHIERLLLEPDLCLWEMDLAVIEFCVMWPTSRRAIDRRIRKRRPRSHATPMTMRGDLSGSIPIVSPPSGPSRSRAVLTPPTNWKGL